MKTTKLFFMAALALTFAACSNDDNDLTTQQPQKAQGIPFTATISMGGDKATTRALSENGSGLTATWTVDEEVALIHNGIIDKVTVASVSGNDATISGTITTDADGASVTVIFPYSAVDLVTKDVKAGLLAAQDGTLATIAAKYDVRKGTGKLQVSGDPAVASLNGNVSLNNQCAMWKLTLNQTAKDLYITAGGEFLAGATLASEGTEFYVAVPSVSSETVAVVATDGSSNCWSYSKDGVSLATGNYYKSNVAMDALDDDNNKPLYKITGTSGVTIPDGKTVVLSDVNISGGSITCNGNANIILMGDNTVTAAANTAAIEIGGSGTTLTITGSGSLTVKGGNYAAAIGTGYANNASVAGGNIEINGGTITATGGTSSAAIGTGYAYYNGHNKCGAITINGGTVTAYGGYAGIGTGGANQSSSNECGAITINGGTVSAQGVNGAGIGTGNTNNSGSNECGAITINGGTVTATGGQRSAAIGTGNASNSGSNECGAITISTGVTSVTATKGNNSPNSIGKGFANNGSQTCGTITIGGDATTYADGVTESPFYYPTAP